MVPGRVKRGLQCIENRRKPQKTTLTVEQVQKLDIGILFCAGGVPRDRAVLHAIECRQVQVAELIEIEELGVGEEGKLRIDIEGILLLLLQRLVVG